ncbi:MAG: protein kinase domain-containing protein, partial [Terriglobia bacterium]
LFVNLAHLAVSADGQSLFGAPEYISPEQAVGTSAEALDGRSDLYSLGVILYRMLTGELPLQGANAMEMLLAQIFSEPCPFSETAGRETPVAVETLVMRTLAKRREDRPPSATALIDQLAAWEDRKAPTRRLAVVPLAQAKPEALHSTAVPPPEPEPPAPRVTPVTAPAMAATPELPEIPVFEMRASDTSAPSLELQPHKEDVALDLDPGESSAAPVEAAPDAVAELEFSPERSREPSPVSSTLPHDDFSADLRESSEAAFSISLPGEAAAERADPGEESERAEWTSQVAEEHDDSAPPFAAHSAQAHTGGFDIQFGLPEIPKPDSATMERAQDTEPVRAMPPVLPVAVHAAASGPVLFANYSPRPKRRRRWPKALAIAAIVILILIGAGCGFLYYTGRSYWLNPDYVRMRVSSFLNGGTTSSSPQVETDAYSQSNPLSTAPNSAPPGVSTAVPSASAGSSKPGASPVGGAAPSRSTEQPEQHQGMQQSANANNPGLAASTAATPTAAEPSPNLARPSGTPETARVPQKQVRRAPRAVENTAGLVAAAITRGDYYFNRGDYDAAIRAYQDGLTHSPSNAQLTAEIARARKAKAAEAKYLQ